MSKRNIPLLIILLLGPSFIWGQYDQNRSIVFTSLEEAMAEDRSRVYYLDLKQQGLTSIPKVTLEFENLIHLNLAHNELSNLQDIDFSSLKHLEEIILYDNAFKAFPYEALDSAPNLKVVDLGENEISTLSNSLSSLRFIEKIDLSNNRIESTSEDIKLPYLQSLTLERNYLSIFPTFILHSKKLRSLNIFGNSINEIPSGINQLSKLEYLNIGDNPIHQIAKDIRLRRLETLILDWVDLSQLSLSLSFIEASSQIESLSLEHCSLEAVPTSVFSLRRLQELSLLHNEIYQIPKPLRSLKRLEKIWIGGSLIEDFNSEN